METKEQKARREMWEECAGMARLTDDVSGKRPSNIGASDFALELIKQEIRGEITIDEAIEKVEKYHVARNTGRNAAKVLQALETDDAVFQLGKLRDSPIQGKFDVDRLRETHRRLYERIYDWAGDLCIDSNFTNGKLPDEIIKSLNVICDNLTHTDWKEMPLENQAHTLADRMVDIWKEQSFRKGNTLVTVEFICDFADAHGMPAAREIYYNNPKNTFMALTCAAFGSQSI